MKVYFQYKLTKQWEGKCILSSLESSLLHSVLATEDI